MAEKFISPPGKISLGARPDSGPIKAELEFGAQYPLRLQVWPNTNVYDDEGTVVSTKDNPAVARIMQAQLDGERVQVHYALKQSDRINENTGKPYENRTVWGVCTGDGCKSDHDLEPKLAELMPAENASHQPQPTNSSAFPAGQVRHAAPPTAASAPVSGSSQLDQRLKALELAIQMLGSAATGHDAVVFAQAADILDWASGNRAPTPTLNVVKLDPAPVHDDDPF